MRKTKTKKNKKVLRKNKKKVVVKKKLQKRKIVSSQGKAQRLREIYKKYSKKLNMLVEKHGQLVAKYIAHLQENEIKDLKEKINNS